MKSRPSHLLTMSSLHGIPIKLVVGTDQQNFFVHPSLLEHSEFFQSALKREWVEGQERAIHLPDDDSAAFYTYVQWFYTGTIFSKAEGPHGYSNYPFLGKLYVLGDKILDHNFQDTVTNAFVAATRQPGEGGTIRLPAADVASQIYQGTPKKSPACRLMVDIFVTHGAAVWLERFVDNTSVLDAEFLLDLSMALLNTKAGDVKSRTPYRELASGDVACAYHAHEKDKPCKKSP